MIFVFVFVLGAIIGSFLNVVLYRLPRGLNFGASRSFCPHCKKILRWYQLIPIFSFVFQKGRCAFCQKKISWHYPLVEFLTGIIFVLIFRYFGDFSFLGILKIAFLWGVGAILILACFYDIFYYEIPNGFIILLFVFGILYFVVEFFQGKNLNFQSHLLGFLVGGGFLFPFFYFSDETLMGGADVKLMAFLGGFLGFPLVLMVLASAFIIGGFFASWLLIFKIKKPKDPLPFGPFLILGFFLTLFFGNFVLNLYLG